jgi:aminopeptidase N
MNEDPFYDAVAAEIQQGHLKPGLWTKAFAKANGDQTKARVIYIRERVTQLQQEALEAIRSQQESQRRSKEQQEAQEQIAERKRIEEEFNHRYATDPFMRYAWLIPVVCVLIAFLVALLTRPQ